MQCKRIVNAFSALCSRVAHYAKQACDSDGVIQLSLRHMLIFWTGEIALER